MKFLLDLCVSPKIIPSLNQLGFTAIRVNQIKEQKAKDSEIWKYALKNKMAIITQDLDYTDILAYTHSKYPSTIIIRLKYPTVRRINDYLKNILQNQEIMGMIQKGSIIIIEDVRVRIKSLPIE